MTAGRSGSRRLTMLSSAVIATAALLVGDTDEPFDRNLPVPTIAVVSGLGELYARCGYWIFPPCAHPSFDILVGTRPVDAPSFTYDLRIRATVGCIGFGTQERRHTATGGRQGYQTIWMSVGAGSNICFYSSYAASVRFVAPDGTFGRWSDEASSTILETAVPR